MTAKAPTTAPKALTTWAQIKSSLSEFFAIDAVSAFEALTDKNQKHAPMARALVGMALERAYSGSTGRLSALRAKAENSKGANKAPTLLACSQIEAIKPQSLKGKTLEAFEELSEELFLEFLTSYAPKARKARTGPSALAIAKAKIEELETALMLCNAECEALKKRIAQSQAVTA